MEDRTQRTLRSERSRSCRRGRLFVRAGRRDLEHLLRLIDNAYLVLAATFIVTQFLATFEEFPPRQKSASFAIDHVVEKLEAAPSTGR